MKYDKRTVEWYNEKVEIMNRYYGDKLPCYRCGMVHSWFEIVFVGLMRLLTWNYKKFGKYMCEGWRR